MMTSKLNTPGVVGGLLAGLVLGTALAAMFSAAPPSMAQAQAPPAAPVKAAPEQPGTNKALADDQLKLARQALEELESLRQNAKLQNLDPRFAVWERRQVEAVKASGVGKAELVSALEKYVKRMKDLLMVAEASREAGMITHVDVLDWQYRVLEAEMWLNQEKSR
jgi:Spy/CpxP family protein refolding chaperone